MSEPIAFLPPDCWVSHPWEWQPRFLRWSIEQSKRLRFHEWQQLGGQKVCALTFGDDGRPRPIRLLVGVPHAHEPAPTAAIVNLAAHLLTGKRLDGSAPPALPPDLEQRMLLTLIPDTNSQGRARSPRRYWDGTVDNEEFYKNAFGEAADGMRFGRYPEWKHSEHLPRRVGVVYEQVEDDLWVESNTSRKSTHTRAIDQMFARYRYTHYLDMHQHEGDEAALLPAEYDQFDSAVRTRIDRWADAVLQAWKDAGFRQKGKYVPYRGQPRQQFFLAYWAGRCPGMLKLTCESRNNRHTETGEPTPPEHQFRSSTTALYGTLRHLLTAGEA